MLERDVAEGVHRVEDAHVNWYVVQEAARLTVVDTGLPRSWASLQSACSRLPHLRHPEFLKIFTEITAMGP